MLIKILAILSIVGIVMSIITILIKGMNFIALCIAHAILKSEKRIDVNYVIPITVLYISVIVACLCI